jgi:RimJ/RimL family protein N-acetyltransferase
MAYEEVRDRPLAEVTADLRTRYTGRDSVILGAFDHPGRDALGLRPRGRPDLRPELVGLAGCFRMEGRKNAHKTLIWGMYVAPEARGRGTGRALLDAAIARARAWPGVEQVQLAVMTANAPARALYVSAGFEVFGLERRALKVGDRYVDEEHMVLHLPSPGE